MQDWNNSVRLIEGKPTIVRAFVESTDGTTTEARGRLYGTRDGVALKSDSGEGFLQPLNPISESTVAPDATARRGSFNSSHNFQLPRSWLEGTVELRYEFESGDKPECNEPAGTTANDCKATVTFTPGGTPEVKFVGVPWFNTTSNTSVGGNAGLLETMMRVQSTFPVADIEDSYAVFNSPIFRAAGAVTQNEASTINADVIAALSALRSADGCDEAGSACADTIYYGVVPQHNLGGLANAIPGTTAMGTLHLTGRNYNVAAHELAHTFNERHTTNQPQVGGPATGWCGEGNSFATNYPYSGNVGPSGVSRPTLGPINSAPNPSGILNEIWGMDTRFAVSGERGGLAVIDPREHYALMSYCSPNGAPAQNPGEWMSVDVYNRLIDRGYSVNGTRVAARVASLVGPSSPLSYMSVRGFINLDSETVEFQPFGSFTTGGGVAEPEPGDYSLVLKDAGGDVISVTSFEASEPERTTMVESDGSEGPRLAPFNIPVLIDDTPVETVTVMHDDTELGTIQRSGNAPTVEIVSPSTGDSVLEDTLRIEWSASDVDPEAELTSTVKYSHDGGTTWQTLALDHQGSSLDVPRSQLAGTDDARVKVIVSDGFLTGTADSGRFSIAGNPPTIEVHNIDGATYGAGQAVSLSALVRDLEDGDLGAGSVTWSSTLDGVLGQGTQLVIAADDLSAGEHVIAVRAKDSDGYETRKSFTLTVDGATPDANAVPPDDDGGTGGGTGGGGSTGGGSGGGGTTPTPTATPTPTPSLSPTPVVTPTTDPTPDPTTPPSTGCSEDPCGTPEGDTLTIDGNGMVIQTLGGDDDIIVSGCDNKIFAGAGNDTVEVLDCNNKVFGGADDDEISVGGSQPGALIASVLRSAFALQGEASTVTLVGGAGNDRLIGGPSKDVIRGRSGDDVGRGGPGPDVLFGGPGTDRLFGGPGKDKIRSGPGQDRCFPGKGRDSRC